MEALLIKDEFKIKVKRELEEAKIRALSILYGDGYDHLKYQYRGKKRGFAPPVPKELTKSRFAHKDRCKVCNVHLDDLNPECMNCRARHSMRRTALRKRARVAE